MQNTERTTTTVAPGSQSHHQLPALLPPSTPLYFCADSPSGHGLFASRRIERGELITSAHPIATYLERTDRSFEVLPGRHVELSNPAPLINHACVPNLGVQDNAAGGLDFIAQRGIQKGEQLRTHYGMHEWRSIAVDRCHCGSSACKGRAFGFGELDDDTQQALIALGVAGHLEDEHSPTSRLAPRGLHATVALGEIPADLMAENFPPDEHGRLKVQTLLDQVTRVIGMTPYGEPLLSYYPTDGSRREGWTAVQLIETSSITAHIYRTGTAWISIESCKPFHVPTVVSWLENRLQTASTSVVVTELI